MIDKIVSFNMREVDLDCSIGIYGLSLFGIIKTLLHLSPCMHTNVHYMPIK